MKKFKLDGYHAYVITETDDGFYINNCNGFLMESEQLLELSKGLAEYASKRREEIEEFNRKRAVELEREIRGF